MPTRITTGQTVYGNALSFNGTSQYAINTADLTGSTNNWTMSLWVKITAYPASGNACLFDIGQTDANGFRIVITSAGLLRTLYSTILNLSSGATLSLATWYNVTVVRTSGTLQHYVDGATAGSTSATTPFTPNAWTVVGASKASTGVISEYTNAVIDDVLFYERALSATEIADVYSRGNNNLIVVDPSSLKARWKFNETSGTSLANDVSSSFTMTATGSPSFVTGIVVISNVSARTEATGRSTATGRTTADY